MVLSRKTNSIVGWTRPNGMGASVCNDGGTAATVVRSPSERDLHRACQIERHPRKREDKRAHLFYSGRTPASFPRLLVSGPPLQRADFGIPLDRVRRERG